MQYVWYNRDNCPICGPEGELHIVKRATGQLCFRCAECLLTFDSPNDLCISAKGHRPADLDEPIEPPSKEEIVAYGWGEYCTHTERVAPKV